VTPHDETITPPAPLEERCARCDHELAARTNAVDQAGAAIDDGKLPVDARLDLTLLDDRRRRWAEVADACQLRR
jgi:hypothetical protein